MKSHIYRNVLDSFSYSKIIHFLAFLVYTITLSVIISSKNFFFKSIIENGISKKDIIAHKTLTVVDIDKTEMHKKEIAQRIDPILTPAEDDFIKNNLATLESSILQIRKKDDSVEIKRDELGLLLEISDGYKKDYIINYLLKTDDKKIQQLFDKATLTLVNILGIGITEKDYEKNDIAKIINRNMGFSGPKSQASVIRTLLEQVIVPNLVVDEYATDVARRNAQALVKPYEVTFEKGEKILFEGEPVTKLKKSALLKAGYNVIDIGYKGFL